MDAPLRLERRLESLYLLAEWIERYAGEQGLGARAAFQLDLVLAEAVTNIIEHGGGAAIELHCRRQDQDILVELRDDGPPFDPTLKAPPPKPASLEDAQPGGLGVHLMRQYTRELRYQRVADQNLLSFSLSADA